MGKIDEISNHATNRRTEDAEDVRKGVKKRHEDTAETP